MYFPDGLPFFIIISDSNWPFSFQVVALLKGESWGGNQGAGLIHRSPQILEEKKRLLLTLDFIDE